MTPRWEHTEEARQQKLKAKRGEIIKLANEIFSAINRRENFKFSISQTERQIKSDCAEAPKKTERESLEYLNKLLNTLENYRSVLRGIDWNYFKHPQREFKKPPLQGDLSNTK